MKHKLYFLDLLYDLTLVAEIYCSWITLAGPSPDPEMINKTNLRETTIFVDHTIKHDTIKSNTIDVNFTYIPQTNTKENVTITIAPDEEEMMSTITTASSIQDDELDKTLKTFSRVDNDTESFSYVDTLINQVKSNTEKRIDDVYFSSFVTHTDENTRRDIVWTQKESEYDVFEVIIFNKIIPDLKLHSFVKMMMIHRKNQSQIASWKKKSEHGPLITVKTESIEKLKHKFAILQIKINKTEYLPNPEANWICVYWNHEYNNWETEGLETTYDTHFIVCSSKHLSTFSVLLDPTNLLYPNDLRRHNLQEQFILTIISVTGSLITIPCLLLIIVIYYHKKSDSETTKILINSCFALLVAHVSYQIYTWFGDLVNCLIINILTHFSVLSFLLWTAFDGINMWRILFTDVFNTKGFIFYRWYKMISWGIPFVTIVIGIMVTDYRRKKCELYFHRIFDIIMYITPCTLILCCNMLLFFWMLFKVTCKNSLGRLKDKKFDYVIALTQVFGIGWCMCVPLLWFPATHLVGEYLFAILVSSQGVFIFIVRCYNDKKLRKQILESIGMKKISIPERIYTMTSSSSRRSSSSPIGRSYVTTDTSSSEKSNRIFHISLKD